MATSSPGINSGVNQCCLDVFVAKKLFDSFKIAGVCIEHDLSAEMAELMRGQFDTRSPVRIPANEISDRALRFGCPIGKHEHALGSVANVRGCDLLPVFK